MAGPPLADNPLDPEPAAVTPSGDAAGQSTPVQPAARPPAQSAVPPTGRRQALRDLRRQLTDAELGTTGVQKLLLDELERADSQCDYLQPYVERFHEAEKRAAVLGERLNTQKAFEVLFGVGVGLGGAIIGLAPLFWNDQPKGALTLALGAAMIVGSVVGRVIKR